MIFMMCVPTFGFSVLAGSFHSFSERARCLGLATTMSAGSRWAKVPTSRAVPQAEGCPVSEKAPLPGLAGDTLANEATTDPVPFPPAGMTATIQLQPQHLEPSAAGIGIGIDHYGLKLP